MKVDCSEQVTVMEVRAIFGEFLSCTRCSLLASQNKSKVQAARSLVDSTNQGHSGVELIKYVDC